MSKILVTLQNYYFNPSEKYFFLCFCNHKTKVSLKNKDVKFFDENYQLMKNIKFTNIVKMFEKIINTYCVLNNSR